MANKNVGPTKSVSITIPKELAERFLLIRKMRDKQLVQSAVELNIEAIVSMYENHSNVNPNAWKTAKTCPSCSSGIVFERIKKGDFKPSFMGCSNFPSCRHKENLKNNGN